MNKLWILTLLFSFTASAAVPIKDGILFGFEKCKSLAVDLHKGQLKEEVTSSFDLHCKKQGDLEFKCSYFDPGSSKVSKTEVFSGGSDLGVADLQSVGGSRLRFLIGKSFASFASGPEQKVCAGIYLFEQDALKRKNIR